MHLFSFYQMQNSENVTIPYSVFFQSPPESRNLGSSSPGTQTWNTLFGDGREQSGVSSAPYCGLLWGHLGECFNNKKTCIYPFYNLFWDRD